MPILELLSVSSPRKMLQFHPSAVEKCQKSNPLDDGKKYFRSEFSRTESKNSNFSKKMSNDFSKKNSTDFSKKNSIDSTKRVSYDPLSKPLTRNEAGVDVELCHIVAFATEADLQVKKIDDKQVHVHFEKVGCY